MTQHHAHPPEKVTGHRAGAYAEEVFDLRAGDEQRDAVGKAYDHRTRNEFDRRPQAGGSQQDEQAAGHDGA